MANRQIRYRPRRPRRICSATRRLTPCAIHTRTQDMSVVDAARNAKEESKEQWLRRYRFESWDVRNTAYPKAICAAPSSFIKPCSRNALRTRSEERRVGKGCEAG